MKLVAQERDWLWLRHATNPLEQCVSVLALLLRLIEQERVWFEVVNPVVNFVRFRILLKVLNVDLATLLLIFKVDVGVPELFLALLKTFLQLLLLRNRVNLCVEFVLVLRHLFWLAVLRLIFLHKWLDFMKLIKL